MKNKSIILFPLLLTALILAWGFAGMTAVRHTAHAASDFYVATGGSDANDCLSPTNACATISAAIGKAAGGDTIHIAAGTYAENLTVSKSLTFTGAGAAQTIIDGGGSGRVFQSGGSYTIAISDLTLQHGSFSEGAGIYNYGTLSLSRVNVISNTASSLGGGIVNGGLLTITNSTLADNAMAALFNNDGGQVWLENVTVSGNSPMGSGTAGIHNQSGSAVNMTNVTVSGNAGVGILSTAGATVTIKSSAIANNTGYGIVNYATVNVKNSILAANSNGSGATDCAGTIISQGHNLDDDGSCSFSGSGDLSNTDPQLLPLADNGGDTLTHALPLGSPAVDAGDNTDCPATDQRGQARPLDGNGNSTATCDMGAYELLRAAPTSVVISGETTGLASSSYTFQAAVAPITATQPITYVWQADGQSPVTHTGQGITDTVSFNWSATGSKTITVTASNGLGQQVDTHQITIGTGTQGITSVAISGPASGGTNQTYNFTAAATPANATQPITYTWQADGQTAVVHAGQGLTDTVSFSWSSEGSKTITVTAVNIAGSQMDTHVIALSDWYVNAASGDDGNGCQSAADACQTIAGAMGKAASGDTIHIAAGTYAENLYLTKNLTFSGVGTAQTVVDGGGSGRVFQVNNGVTAVFADLTIQNGSSSEGAGIANFGALSLSRVNVVNNNGSSLGGGILTSGILTAANTTISNNAFGGLFINGGQVWLENVTVSGNSSISSGTAGIHSQSSSAVSLTNVTISGNAGYGLLVTDGSTATIKSSTIANNANYEAMNYGTIFAKNSIVSGNHNGGNCTGTITSQGHNLDSGGNCGFSGTGDLTNADAKLAPLADNGGDTQTMALLPGSPAIDAGTNSDCPVTDQRGMSRPKDGDGNGTAVCDMGAYEFDPANPPKVYLYLPLVIRN